MRINLDSHQRNSCKINAPARRSSGVSYSALSLSLFLFSLVKIYSESSRVEPPRHFVSPVYSTRCFFFGFVKINSVYPDARQREESLQALLVQALESLVITLIPDRPATTRMPRLLFQVKLNGNQIKIIESFGESFFVIFYTNFFFIILFLIFYPDIFLLDRRKDYVDK